ncbi:MAG: hypothetical protein HGA54_01675 [Actinobacteria bacterium]|nr:hypothetical protein [Actinomycetota bacterium]
MKVRLTQRVNFSAIKDGVLTKITGVAGDEVEAGIYAPTLLNAGQAEAVKTTKEKAVK